MSIFGKKEREGGYSREEFDNLQEIADARLQNAEAPYRGESEKILDQRWASYGAAVHRLEAMRVAGEKEATELNREYDRLRGKVAEALRTLKEFEREKLGIKDTE